MIKSIPAIVITLLFFLTGYVACIKDKCGNTVCNNGGVCVDAACTCLRGYEGVNCENKWADKYTGDWQVTDVYSKDSNKHIYTLAVSQLSALDSFTIYGLADTININLLCKRDSAYGFSFTADQKVNDTLFVIKSGHGVMDRSGTRVTGMYSFKLGDTLITTNFIWSR